MRLLRLPRKTDSRSRSNGGRSTLAHTSESVRNLRRGLIRGTTGIDKKRRRHLDDLRKEVTSRISRPDLTGLKPGAELSMSLAYGIRHSDVYGRDLGSPRCGQLRAILRLSLLLRHQPGHRALRSRHDRPSVTTRRLNRIGRHYETRMLIGFASDKGRGSAFVATIWNRSTLYSSNIRIGHDPIGIPLQGRVNFFAAHRVIVSAPLNHILSVQCVPSHPHRRQYGMCIGPSATHPTCTLLISGSERPRLAHYHSGASTS